MEELADENEAERNEPARPQAGHEAPHGELPARARRSCQGRQRREGGQGTRHDAPDAEAVRQQSVDQRRRAVRDQVGGNDEPDTFGRDAEPLRQLRPDRRDHERLEEDHERRREHAEQALAASLCGLRRSGDHACTSAPSNPPLASADWLSAGPTRDASKRTATC